MSRMSREIAETPDARPAGEGSVEDCCVRLSDIVYLDLSSADQAEFSLVESQIYDHFRGLPRLRV